MQGDGGANGYDGPSNPYNIGGQNTERSQGPRNENLQYKSSAQQAFKYDEKDIGLSRPFPKDMFSANPKKGNFGAGISSLSSVAQGDRKTEVSNYQNDFAVVQQYQQMMEEIKEQSR